MSRREQLEIIKAMYGDGIAQLADMGIDAQTAHRMGYVKVVQVTRTDGTSYDTFELTPSGHRRIALR